MLVGAVVEPECDEHHNSFGCSVVSYKSRLSTAAFNHGDGQLTGCLAATAAFGYMLDGIK